MSLLSGASLHALTMTLGIPTIALGVVARAGAAYVVRRRAYRPQT
jgi:hypothetical protein